MISTLVCVTSPVHLQSKHILSHCEMNRFLLRTDGLKHLQINFKPLVAITST